MKKIKAFAAGGTTFTLLIYAYLIITWVINFIQFLQCDFANPWREEIIKGVGVIFFPLNGITVWF